MATRKKGSAEQGVVVPAEIEATVSRLADAFRDFLVLLVRLAQGGGGQ
jgi:hypothetical protein